MLTLLIGRAGAGKTAAVIDRMRAGGEERPQIMLVPEQASHQTERRLCQQGGNGTSLYAEVLSFTRLAHRVFAAAGGLARPMLDAGGRLLLLYQAMKEVSAQLRVYARPARNPAFLSGMLATLDELKSCMVSPDLLFEAAQDADAQEGDKLHDLALICGTYEALTGRTAMDPRDRLTRLADTLVQSGWARNRDIYVDGFTDFTPQELHVLGQLVSQANSLTVALTCDHLEEDEQGMGVFSPARHTAAALLSQAKKAHRPVRVETLPPQSTARSPGLAFLEEHLFDGGQEEYPHCPADVELYAGLTPRAEVERTAGRIVELARTKGYRFRDMAVAARGFEAYSDLIASIFPQYGVPVFLAETHDILQKPVLTLVTGALEAVSGYSYDAVFRYLKTGLTNVSPEECDLLENYVLKWGLRGSRWTEKKDWAFHPQGYGQPWTQQDTDLLAGINAIRRKVVEPLSKLQENTQKTGRGQAISLYRYIEEIGLPQRLEEREQLLRERGQPGLAEEYRQLWEILCNALEQCAEILADTPVELEEFSRLFQLVLSQYDVGAIPVSLDRVVAGEVGRVTGTGIKMLFLLGAHDGAIPQVAPSPGLLSDEDRSLLASYGAQLAPRLEEKLYRESTLVYDVCTRPREGLVVSWPLTNGQGEECRPSYLVGRLRQLFPKLTVQQESRLSDAYRLNAPLPALELAGERPDVAAALKTLPDYAPLVERMEQAACWERGRLSTAGVEALYGKKVPMSASRMDQYKSCHFAYFMQYGLKAKPRQPAGFHAPEYGSFVHYVLEHVFQAAQKDWDKPQLQALAREAVDRYVAQELGGLESQTPRFRYLFTRLMRSVYQIVDNVAQELAASSFTPISFELGFGSKGDLPPVEMTIDGITLSISGFVDRVDGWVKDDRLYLRVVDYKTGRKSFDLTEIWNGLGLQMLIYLFTLKREGKLLYGKEVVPAGVLYLPARDAIVAGSRTMSQEEHRRALDQALRRRGLLLDDPEVLEAMEQQEEGELRFLPVKVSSKTGAITGDSLVSAQQMGRLGVHIQNVLGEICKEIAAGSIAADPFWRGPESNACQYCQFVSACHFEEGRGGDRKRWIPTVSNREFWAGLAEDEAHSAQGGELS